MKQGKAQVKKKTEQASTVENDGRAVEKLLLGESVRAPGLISLAQVSGRLRESSHSLTSPRANGGDRTKSNVYSDILTPPNLGRP